MANAQSLFERAPDIWAKVHDAGFTNLTAMAKLFSRPGDIDAALGYSNAASRWNSGYALPGPEAERLAAAYIEKRTSEAQQAAEIAKQTVMDLTSAVNPGVAVAAPAGHAIIVVNCDHDALRFRGGVMGGHNMPCGHRACHAAVRVVVDIAPSVAAAARMSGSSHTLADKIYDEVGVQRPLLANAPRKLPNSVIRRAWADRTRSHIEIAADLGISPRGLCLAAKRLNLPPRSSGRLPRSMVVEWPADFDAMWLAGVFVKDIMQACPRPPKSDANVTKYARRRGLPRRNPGSQKNGIMLIQYLLLKDGQRVREATKAHWSEKEAA